ncbi:MAG: hypothetical protein U0457_06960 [Candidatus Sericytochromatia bacterium]
MCITSINSPSIANINTSKINLKVANTEKKVDTPPEIQVEAPNPAAIGQFKKNLLVEPTAQTNLTFLDPKIENNGGRESTISAIKTIPSSQLENAWVGKIASNKNPDGNSETAILTPKGFDPNKPVKIVYYFHGHNNGVNAIASSINDLKNKEGKPPLSSIMEYAKENNAIVVIPQGPQTDGDGNKKGSWMEGKNTFENFNQDIINKIPSLKGKDISVEISGHSAGGLAVRNLVESISNNNSFDNKEGGKTSIGKVNFLDASYHSGKESNISDRADRTYASISKINKNSDKKINFEIVVTTNGDRTYNIDGKKVNSTNLPSRGSWLKLNYQQGKAEHMDVPRMFFSGKL